MLALSFSFRPPLAGVFVSAAVLLLAGCDGGAMAFRPNAVFLLKEENAAQVRLTEPQRQDIANLLEHLFGTPDEPRLSTWEDTRLTRLLNREKLRTAAGPVRRDGAASAGLYRQHCALCHGIAGDGAGPTAAMLNPYPRDFRRGVFKFKTTFGPATPPTHADLLRIVANGNPGTGMPSFRRLPDTDREALAEYMKYLAIRGLAERFLISWAADELEPDQRLVDLSLAERNPPAFANELEPLRTMLAGLVEKWTSAADKVTAVPERAAGGELAATTDRGRTLFRGQVANCIKCHGDADEPATQAPDYDDWTKEIIDPGNPDAWRQYVAVGALPPRAAQPRDLQHGVYRGGAEPTDLYRRIHDGIAGTPMPAAAMRLPQAGPDDKSLSPADVWSLVDYVLYLRTR